MIVERRMFNTDKTPIYAGNDEWRAHDYDPNWDYGVCQSLAVGGGATPP